MHLCSTAKQSIMLDQQQQKATTTINNRDQMVQAEQHFHHPERGKMQIVGWSGNKLKCTAALLVIISSVYIRYVRV